MIAKKERQQVCRGRSSFVFFGPRLNFFPLILEAQNRHISFKSRLSTIFRKFDDTRDPAYAQIRKNSIWPSTLLIAKHLRTEFSICLSNSPTGYGFPCISKIPIRSFFCAHSQLSLDFPPL